MPRQSNIAGQSYGHLVLWCCVILVLLGPRQCSSAPAPVCPGLQNGVCTGACQSATCSALASFFRSTFNATRNTLHTLETHSWANRSGWEITRTQPCQQILSARGRSPSYCSWYGITCCTAEAAAQQECRSVHSVLGIKIQVNGVNGSVEDPTIVQDIQQLHACGLTRLSLQGNDLSGALSSTWGSLTNLTVLDLSNNWINGTIPAALRSLTKLTVLSLGQNFLSGPLPGWFGELTALQSLSLGANAGQNADGTVGLTGSLPASLATLRDLELLNLETNALTGTLPAGLCLDSKLSILKLRANSLGGQLDQLLDCQKLTQLDISSNHFTGTLPDSNSWNWSQLVALDVSDNRFEGSIPDALYGLSVLGYLNLGHNRLSGSIQRAITLMQYLKSLQLNDNQLTGPVDENLWYLPQLSVLDLSHNRLTGTISKAVGLAFGLEEVILDNNQLTGSLPAELGIPKDLKLVDVRNNSALSCHGEGSNASGACDAGQLLPCFLMFSSADVPRTDGSDMSCPAILRRPRQEAEQLCSGNGPNQLGDQATNLADEAEAQQRFELDPTYYGYYNCQCLGGYREVWERNHTVLTCVKSEEKDKPAWVVPAVSVAAVAAVMLLAAAALLVWLRMTVQLRPRWQREKELNENRKKGMPSGGPATIVVTDVESYSDLMQVNAPLTTKAMGIHNAILRKAVAAHAGHVVEQEGDSWSVAFHTPMDAVAFCLQVQQALQRTNWPTDMGGRHSKTHRSFLSNRASSAPPAAAAAAADNSTRGNGSMLGSTVSPATPRSAFGSVVDSQRHSVSWSQQLQSCRAGSGGSNDLSTVACHSTAGAAAGSAALPGAAGPGLAARLNGQLRNGSFDPTFDPLIEDDAYYSKPAAVVAPAGGSLDSLMVLGDRNRADLQATVQPSALSADGLTERLAKKWGGWPGFGAKSRASSATSQQPARLQQEQIQESQQPQQQQSSFSSLISIPSLLASDRAASELSGPAVAGPSSTVTTPTGSFQNLLQSWRNKVRNTGSSASGSDMQADSFSGHPAAAVAENLEAATEGPLVKHAGSAPPAVLSRFNQGGSATGTAPSLSLASGLGPAASGALPGRQQQSSSRFWSMLGMPARDKGGQYGTHTDGVIRGLRVRVGVATGWVPRSTNIGRSALFELAKAVSDMANGGQVLLEANTFAVVRDRLTELGTVDHRGYNDKLRATASRAVMRQQTSCLFGSIGRLLGISLDSNPVDTDALLLDMGEYFLPTLGPVIPAAAGGEAPSVGLDVSNPLARGSGAPPLNKDISVESGQSLQPPAGLPVATATSAAADDVELLDAGVSVAAAAVLGSSAVPDLANQCLQLYGILPRTLHERAKLWLNSLTFREGTQQIVKSYFDAPGTGVADLSSSSGVSTTYTEFDKPPLPAVTMIFAAVEGGKTLVRKKPEVARIVHNALGRIMQLLLMAMPERDGHQDGYLCRQQEGVLKYMLAFREPARAVEWALLLQEVLLHIPWPDEVLQELGASASAPQSLIAQTSSAAQTASGDSDGSPKRSAGIMPGGQLKMKIGLAEGHPDSISPDHLGRPDYFGNSVNLAARMMDAAAQGGQVVCSVMLADKIYSTWRFEAELGLYDLSQDDASQQQQQQQQEPGKHTSQLQQQQQSERVPAMSSPFAVMNLLASNAGQQQQQGGQAPSNAEIDTTSTPGTPKMAAAAAAAGRSGSNAVAVAAASSSVTGSQGSSGQAGMKMSRSRANLLRQLLNKSAMLLDGPSYPQRLVHISGQHIGTYAFKGCGALDMLSFTTDFMPAPEVNPAGAKGGKGTLVLPGTGPVVGLQDCPIILPDVLPILQQAWAAAAAAAQAVQQQQQDRLLLHKLSLSQSARQYRRCHSVSSAATFTAAAGEVPDGVVRYKAANDLLRKSLSDAGNPKAVVVPAVSGSWSGGVGPISAAAAAAAAHRLPRRLASLGEQSTHSNGLDTANSADFRNTSHQHRRFSDIETADGPQISSGLAGSAAEKASGLSAEQQLPATNGSIRFWPQQQHRQQRQGGNVRKDVECGASTAFDGAQPRDVELAARV